MTLYLGDDWSEDHHDVHLMNEAGERLAARRLPEGVEGVTALHGLVAEHASGPGEVIVGIETDRGPWVGALLAAGYRVYAINPRSASRYRDRHHVGGAKSDAGDAKLLADLVRTDRHNHREVAGDSDEAAAVRIFARAHQQLVWDRTRLTNRLRNALREYFPGRNCMAFPSLAHGVAVGVLATAPGPREAARLTMSIRCGPRCAAAAASATSRGALPSCARPSAPSSSQCPATVSRAFASTTSAAVAQIDEINRQIAELEAELAASFEQHPDAHIYRSLPGLGVVLGARVLGEFGDDPDRYDSAKSRRNYAGTSPLTVASGRKHTVKARFIRNRRLSDAADQWALCSLQVEPGLPRLLRPAARRRRPPPPGAARPREPPRRLPPRLSQDPLPLRRVHPLGPPPGSGTTRRLTP